MTTKDIHGILAYPVTPFTDDNDVDTGKLAALVERLVSDGAHGIVPLGSTGESAYLTEAEFDAVIDTTIGVVAGRVPVIIGASDLTTANTIRRAQYAERAGADAVMVLPISYWKLSEREIAQHYAAIGAAIGIPIMVYNNPATSGIDMRPELLVQMFTDVDNVTMVKESTGDLTRMQRIAELSGGQLPFYNGSNPMVLKAFNAGAKGWCTAASNLRPQPCLDLYEAIRAGDQPRAEALYEDLRPLLEFIVAGGLPTTVKGGLEVLGQGVGVPRPPLLPLDEGGRDELKRLLVTQ
ncbi:MAG: dihydrodipicolinate synthase family protein [Mycolicibacterium sp.]|nr:dihydrodipicolinate synthase family protein [Mycolicibacterium sp.]